MKKMLLVFIIFLSVSKANAQKTDTPSSTKTDTNRFIPVDVEPSFPGGIDKLFQFLSKNIKSRGNSGRVVVGFIVEKDGSLTNINIIRTLSESADKEAIRVMSMSPKWNPGTAQRMPVRVRYTIPISFN